MHPQMLQISLDDARAHAHAHEVLETIQIW